MKIKDFTKLRCTYYAQSLALKKLKGLKLL